MRYYDVQIFNDDGSMYAEYTSLAPNGSTNASALNIEMDITQTSMHQPSGDSMVRIWGPDLKDFSNARKFTNKKIKVFGGMKKGLPLANPKQSGLLVQGQIFNAFGNWIETDMTLTFILMPYLGRIGQPANISFNWKAGTSLVPAIANLLTTAFPGVKQNIKLSKTNLILNHDLPGVYSVLGEFAKMIFRVSKEIIKDPNYLGVTINYDGNVINVLDAPDPGKQTTNIELADLIGQPMWIAPLEIQCRFVMRSDIGLVEQIKLPSTPVTTQAAALTQLNDKLTFAGTFTTKDIRHVGNFRQADGNSWSTTINMFPTPAVDNTTTTNTSTTATTVTTTPIAP